MDEINFLLSEKSCTNKYCIGKPSIKFENIKTKYKLFLTSVHEYRIFCWKLGFDAIRVDSIFDDQLKLIYLNIYNVFCKKSHSCVFERMSALNFEVSRIKCLKSSNKCKNIKATFRFKSFF